LVSDRIAREILDDSVRAAGSARSTATAVAVLAALLIVVVAGLAAAGARSIAVPLARLNAAALTVATATGKELERVSDVESDADVAPALQAVPTTGPGDVADLAASFNRVQDAAGALLARQVTTRRNVSAMFATVARRTRNLADRQLNLIDVLERQQQDPQLLDRLYRLDHVATRLRRSASALLVISGAADDVPSNPMRLADVVRAAAAEIEQFARVDLVDAVDVAALPGVVSDLILAVAELLDNAVSYSPPPSPVTVSVSLTGGGCRVSIVDTGIGMSDDQLDAENRRLVERERLDIAPTRVLGLFVVGRLARRHGLVVTLTETRPQGVTVHVDIPGRLLTAAVGPTAPAPQPRGVRQVARERFGALPVPARATAAMRRGLEEHFPWFGDDVAPEVPAPALMALPPPPPAPRPPARPAAALPAAPARGIAPVPTAAVPAAAATLPMIPAQRSPLHGVGAEPAAPPREPAPIGPSGLSRRVPGTHLPPAAVPQPEEKEAVAVDPAAARAEALAFTQGFERGTAVAQPAPAAPLARPAAAPVARPAPVVEPVARVAPPPQWPIPTSPPPAPVAPATDEPEPAETAASVAAPVATPGPGEPAPVEAGPARLTRRVPGANLADELRLPANGQPAVGRASAMPGVHLAGTASLSAAVTQPLGAGPSAPPDRDPDAEQHTVDTLIAAFARADATASAARAEAAPADAAPMAAASGGTGGEPESDGPTPPGPETQDVERR
jgi:signal transduction histidine kinase